MELTGITGENEERTWEDGGWITDEGRWNRRKWKEEKKNRQTARKEKTEKNRSRKAL